MKRVMLAAALCAMPVAANAQDSVYWPAPARADGGQQMLHLPVGTPIALTTRTDLSTKDARTGDLFYLEVAQPVVHNGQVIVPVGAVAVGQVMRSERNGHFGKKGKLTVRLLNVQTPHGPARLSGKSGNEGRSGGWVAIGGGLVVSPLMFLVHGTSGRIAAGSPVTGYLADDLTFAANPAMQDRRSAQAGLTEYSANN